MMLHVQEEMRGKFGLGGGGIRFFDGHFQLPLSGGVFNYCESTLEIMVEPIDGWLEDDMCPGDAAVQYSDR